MTAGDPPKPFGEYLLTALLGQDALGRVFRAVRLSGEKGFVRLRILETPELSEESVLDAIQEYGEIHSFLKNPAIARGVQMDAVEGTPFIAWNEESGRTLDALLERVRAQGQRVPPEHSLLIAEKMASALEHAYNTTVDGERTLHGLVWPGFVCITDDGETRLTGFGLAAGVMPSLQKPRLSAEVGPYIAPEQRAEGKVGRNSDVFSVGVLLFELLAGRLPSLEDSLPDVRTLAREEGHGLTPEVVALLRTALSPPDARYQSAAELRRELGKLLFSGPYSPSTFNLAFFLNGLFGSEIESEAAERDRESRLEVRPGGPRQATPRPVHRAAAPPAPPQRSPGLPDPVRAPAEPATQALPTRPAPTRRSVAIVVAALLVAAVGGAVYLLWRGPWRETVAPAASALPVPAATATPTAVPTPEAVAPTAEMTDTEFKDEVSRRVTQEMKKLEEALRKKQEAAAGSPPGPTPSAAAPPPERAAPPAADVTDATPPPIAPTPALEAVRVPVREPPATAAIEAPQGPREEIEVPPRLKRVIRPNYPPIALRQRIGGIVILRILVSETGSPLEVEVVRGVRGGLSEAAAAAARRWTFEPATRNGRPIAAWTTVPIPFEP